jgi:hypothetical protein
VWDDERAGGAGANPFDQFDPPPASAENPFDRFDANPFDRFDPPHPDFSNVQSGDAGIIWDDERPALAARFRATHAADVPLPSALDAPSPQTGPRGGFLDAIANASRAAGSTATAALEDTAADANLIAGGARMAFGENPDSSFARVRAARAAADRLRAQGYDLSKVGAAGGEVLGLAPLIFGGEAMLPERAGSAVTRLGRAVESVGRQLPVAAGIGQQQSATGALDVLDRGGDIGTAEEVYGASLPMNTAANLLPASVGGGPLTRILSGAGLGAGASAATQESLHALAPEYFEGPSLESTATGAGVGALFGVAGGRPNFGHDVHAGTTVHEQHEAFEPEATPPPIDLSNGQVVDGFATSTPAGARTRENLPDAVAARVAELSRKSDRTPFEDEELSLLNRYDEDPETASRLLGIRRETTSAVRPEDIVWDDAPGPESASAAPAIATSPKSEAAPSPSVETPTATRDNSGDAAATPLPLRERAGSEPGAAPDLTGNAITDAFAARLRDDHEQAVREYSELPDTRGGTILNTDLARELSPDYRADRTKSADVHEPASAFIKRVYAEKLAQPTPEGMDPVVVFSAGGTGSGKTTGINAAGAAFGRPEIVYDTNMNRLSSATSKIDAALQAGRNVSVLYTYREPVDAFRGAMARADRMERERGSGRTVPIDEHVNTHVGAARSVRQLVDHYAGDDRVNFIAIDNSRGPGQHAVADLEALPHVEENGLHEKLREELDRYRAEGRISDAVYRGFLATPHQRESSRDGRGTSSPVGSARAGGRRRSPPGDEIAGLTAAPAVRAGERAPRFDDETPTSRVRGAHGQPIDSLRGELHGSSIGTAFRSLENSGVLRIVDDPAQDFAGRWDGQHAVLNAAHVPAGEGIGVALHELGIHRERDAGLRGMLGDDVFNGLVKRITELESTTAPILREAREAIAEARARIEAAETPAHQRDEELLAYTTEAAARRLAAGSKNSALRDLYDRVVRRLRAWLATGPLGQALSKRGFALKVTPDDLVHIAMAAVRRQARESARSSAAMEPDMRFSRPGGESRPPREPTPSEDSRAFAKPRETDEPAGDEYARASRSGPARERGAGEAGNSAAPRFNSATEFWERAVGRPVYDAIAAATKKLIANDFLKRHGLNLAQDLPPAAKEAWRQYRRDIGAAQRAVSDLGRDAAALTPEERELVSDYIEGEMKAGVSPPANVERVGTLMTSILRKQSADLVELGMLSPETRDRWEGRYLPRFYRKHLLTAPFDRELRTLFLRSIKGSHLKGRGMYEYVAAADVPAYEKMGWEVRDPKGKAIKIDGLDPAAKVPVWRDFTHAEREKMGEIRDAMYRFARGYTETQVDIAKGRLFETIARTVASDHDPGGSWVQVPDTSVPGTGVKKFGKLAGKYVPADVLAELEAKVGPSSELTKAYLKALSLWKEGKTSLNPVVHVNNVVSNIVMADLAGVNVLDPRSLKLYADTFTDYRGKGAAFKEAQRAGLFGGEWYGNEVGRWLPLPGALQDAREPGNAVAMFAKKALAGLGAGRAAMGRLYQAEDQFFKLLLYKQGRARGLSPEDAVTWAERWVFDYSTAAPGVRKLRNTLLPFANYTAKAVPALAFAATHYPWRVAKWVGLLGGFNLYAYDALYGDDSDEMQETEGKLLPDYLRGRSSFFGVPKVIRMPFNDASTDAALYVDVSRFLPLGDLFDANNQAGGAPLPAPVTPNNPLITVALGMLGNKDSFTGKDIVRVSDTAGDAAEKRLVWLYRQMAPNNPLVPGSYSFNRLGEAASAAAGRPIGPYTGLDYNGATIPPGRTAAQTIGIKVRTVDLEREQQWRISDLRKEENDIRAQMRSLKRNQSISDETRDRELDALQEKLQRVRERRGDVAGLEVP